MKISARVSATGIAAKPRIVGDAIAAEIGVRTADAGDELKARLRRDTEGPLGRRVANTWRGFTYPVKRPTRTLNPAALVTSNASELVAAFDPGATITAKNATFLAIPTENVPKAGRAGKRMTPVEVEARFNQELEIVPSPKQRGVFLLMFTGLVGKRGFRSVAAKASARVRARAQRVVMFVLVPRVRLKKLLDWRRIIADAEAAYPQRILAGINVALLRSNA